MRLDGNFVKRTALYVSHRRKAAFWIGGISGLAAAIATQPLDVIKTRLAAGAGFHANLCIPSF